MPIAFCAYGLIIIIIRNPMYIEGVYKDMKL